MRPGTMRRTAPDAARASCTRAHGASSGIARSVTARPRSSRSSLKASGAREGFGRTPSCSREADNRQAVMSCADPRIGEGCSDIGPMPEARFGETPDARHRADIQAYPRPCPRSRPRLHPRPLLGPWLGRCPVSLMSCLIEAGRMRSSVSVDLVRCKITPHPPGPTLRQSGPGPSAVLPSRVRPAVVPGERATSRGTGRLAIPRSWTRLSAAPGGILRPRPDSTRRDTHQAPRLLRSASRAWLARPPPRCRPRPARQAARATGPAVIPAPTTGLTGWPGRPARRRGGTHRMR